MSIGKRIKRLRESLKLTQEDVADKVGVAIQTIYKYENEIVTNIPLDKLEKIASVLNTSPSYLMGWESNAFSAARGGSSVYLPLLGSTVSGAEAILSEHRSCDMFELPASYLKDGDSGYFVLRISGDSMYPMYQDGDKVLVKQQGYLNYSGEIGAIIGEDGCVSLKKLEYVRGEAWLRLVSINPNIPPVTIKGEALSCYRIVGIPCLLIREIINI